MVENQFETNAYGIRIKQCCASCVHKRFTRAVTTRRCRKYANNVSPSYSCKAWVMSEQLKNVGRTQGVVKDRVTKEIVIG